MKKQLIVLFLIIMASSSFAQNSGFLLVRISPTDNRTSLTLEQLEQIDTSPNDTIIAIGTLSDGSGIMIVTTTWDTEIEGNTVSTFPLNIDYNMLCKVLEEGVPQTATFVQYNTYITKFNVQQVPLLQNAHYNYLKQLKHIGSVLLEGYFNNDDGGLILLVGTVDNEVINSDPTIMSGFIIPEIKKITLIRSQSCIN